MGSYKSRQYWMCLASSPHPKIPQIAAIQSIIWGKHYNISAPHTTPQTSTSR